MGTNVTGNDADDVDGAVAAAEAADVVIYVGGIDSTVEKEEKDRTEISWPDNQLALLGALEEVGKPLVVIQFGGGQLDDTPLKESDAVCTPTYPLSPTKLIDARRSTPSSGLATPARAAAQRSSTSSQARSHPPDAFPSRSTPPHTQTRCP